MAGRYFRGNSKAEVNGSGLPFPHRLLKTHSKAAFFVKYLQIGPGRNPVLANMIELYQSPKTVHFAPIS